MSSGGIVSVIVRLQLEDELHVQVGCSVRGVKGLLGLSPLGLISRLLRGQVRHLYIMRGDVSIYNQAKRLEGDPFSLAGHGRSPAAGLPQRP